MSLLIAGDVSPAASYAAAPLLEPPDVLSIPRVSGATKRIVRNSSTLVLPRRIPLAVVRRSTTGELLDATRSKNGACPKAERTPTVSSTSSIVNGTPWSGPHVSSFDNASSASCARHRAPWSSSVIIAFKVVVLVDLPRVGLDYLGRRDLMAANESSELMSWSEGEVIHGFL